MEIQDEKWYDLQRKKFADRLQNAIDEEFSRTHDLIMENLVPKEKLKDKGTMRNINNYRMKLWCDMFIEYKKQGDERSLAASYASKDLQMFDLQFNP
jgi:hypothetical protein